MGSYVRPARWRDPDVVADYFARCHRLGIPPAPAVDAAARLEDVCDLAGSGDAAAIEIAVELVLSDAYFYYSGFAKSRAARRLRRVRLTAAQVDALREGLMGRLEAGRCGQELRELVKLVRHLGLGPVRARVVALLDVRNRRVAGLAAKLLIPVGPRASSGETSTRSS